MIVNCEWIVLSFVHQFWRRSVQSTIWGSISDKHIRNFRRACGEGPYLILHSYSQTFCFPPRTLLELPSPLALHIDGWSRRGESNPLPRSAGDVCRKGFICIKCDNENICGCRNEIPPVNLSPFSGQHFWRLALSFALICLHFFCAGVYCLPLEVRWTL